MTGTCEFDASRPWDLLLAELTGDGAYWKREMEEPAILVLNSVAKLSAVIGGDAPVGTATSGYGKGNHLGVASPVPAAVEPLVASKGKAKQAPDTAGRVHWTVSNGKYTHNRKRKMLCADWQTGQCSRKAGSVVCPKNPQHVHQCNRCLSEKHGGYKCDQAEATQPRWAHKGHKGKGGNRY